MLHGGTLQLGFRDEITADTLRGWFEAQDVAAMLAASNVLDVEPGDCVYVPAGTPHAIGEGVFMVEVQEPSDLGSCSVARIRAARVGDDGPRARHGSRRDPRQRGLP